MRKAKYVGWLLGRLLVGITFPLVATALDLCAAKFGTVLLFSFALCISYKKWKNLAFSFFIDRAIRNLHPGQPALFTFAVFIHLFGRSFTDWFVDEPVESEQLHPLHTGLPFVLFYGVIQVMHGQNHALHHYLAISRLSSFLSLRLLFTVGALVAGLYFTGLYPIMVSTLRPLILPYFQSLTFRSTKLQMRQAAESIVVRAVSFCPSVGRKLGLERLYASESDNCLDSHALFQYSALKGHDTIRLVRLPPQRSTGRIYCELIETTVSLSPSYEAISYTWGDGKPVHDIEVNGKKMAVSSNVYEILQSRRSSLVSRILWIDSICINQCDNREKSIQVSIMRNIYSKANRVIVHLGSAPDADLAVDLLEELRLTVFMYNPTEQELFAKYLPELDMLRAIQPSEVKQRWLALGALLNHPWYSRVWIVQEVVVAKKVHILYGGNWIDWETLFYIVRRVFFQNDMNMFIEHTADYHTNHSVRFTVTRCGNVDLIHRRRFWFQEKSEILLQTLLLNSGTFNATNPLDKVFALQGIASDIVNIDKFNLRPDYDLSVKEVYTRTMKYLLEVCNPTDVLAMAGLHRDSNELPSWVIDFTVGATIFTEMGSANPRFHAGGSGGAYANTNSDNTRLSLRAVQLDQIASLTSILDMGLAGERPPDNIVQLPNTTAEILLFMEEVRTLACDTLFEVDSVRARTGSPYVEDVVDAFWRTLCADAVSTGRISEPMIIPAPPEYLEVFMSLLEIIDARAKFPGTVDGTGSLNLESMDHDEAFDAFPKTIRLVSTLGEEHYLSVVNSWAFSVILACLTRRFFSTEKGYLGLAPGMSREGDIVVVPCGAQVPFILRKVALEDPRKTELKETGESEEIYELVGECYLHGAMQGEITDISMAREFIIV